MRSIFDLNQPRVFIPFQMISLSSHNSGVLLQTSLSSGFSRSSLMLVTDCINPLKTQFLHPRFAHRQKLSAKDAAKASSVINELPKA